MLFFTNIWSIGWSPCNVARDVTGIGAVLAGARLDTRYFSSLHFSEEFNDDSEGNGNNASEFMFNFMFCNTRKKSSEHI